jgi:hypothetical protein
MASVMRSSAKKPPWIWTIFPPLLVFALAAFVYSQYGLYADLNLANSVNLYSGQKMAEGIPHYVSIFDVITPLGPMLAGLGVMISKQLGWSDIYTARLLFFVMGCFAATSVYLLGNSLFRSQRVGVFAALTFLGFFGFAQEIARGPYHKIPMVLFAVLGLLLTSQRRWFLAGLCGSLSFLLWQSAAIFPLVTLFLATMQPREIRPAAIVRTLAGIGLPLVAVGVYFYYHGAFYRLLDASILFHILYGDRADSSLLSRFLKPVQGAFEGYPTMIPAILIGFVMVVYTILSRWVHHRSFREVLAKDAFAPILLSFPALVLWSLIDFDNRKDFFVFLPYAAIGFGKFLDLAVHRIKRFEGAALPLGAQRFLVVGLCVFLVALAVANESIGTIGTTNTKMDDRREIFDEQRQAAIKIEDRFGHDAKLLSIGAPDLLALQHQTNPTPYAFFKVGIDNYIDAYTPGGFEGWLSELEAYNADVIVFEDEDTSGAHKQELMKWLNSNYHYHEQQVGPYKLYVRNPASKARTAQ